MQVNLQRLRFSDRPAATCSDFGNFAATELDSAGDRPFPLDFTLLDSDRELLAGA